MKSSRGPSTPDLRCPSIEANMGETSGESWDKSRKPGLSEETSKVSVAQSWRRGSM